jgi:hypothetical protein
MPRRANMASGLSISKRDRERHRAEKRERKQGDQRTMAQKVEEREARERIESGEGPLP